MRRISRATTKHRSTIRVVFVDRLEREMMDLKALRREVAEAETRVRHPLDLADWGQPPFISGRRS